MIIFLIYKNIFYYNNYSDIFIVVAYIPNDFVLGLLNNIVIWSMGISLLTPLL